MFKRDWLSFLVLIASKVAVWRMLLCPYIKLTESLHQRDVAIGEKGGNYIINRTQGGETRE